MVPDQIILATDFSPASTAARSVAISMAQLFKCKVLIFHVFQYVAHHQYMLPAGWMTEILRRDAQQQILSSQQMVRDMGIETETLLVESGFPSEEILKVAHSFKTSMIVMGTHATAGIDRFLVGSTAEVVLREASCPVITVGPHVRADTRGLDRLLFATDFSDASLKAVPFVGMLRDAAGSSLHVLHVHTDIHAAANSQPDLFDPLRAMFDSPDTPNALSRLPPTEYLTLHGAAVAQAISNEAERLPADLIILGVKRASSFTAHLAPRVAFQIIASAPCPVLTLSS